MKLQRTIKQWAGCEPTEMASKMSTAAIMHALKDARSDILALYICVERLSATLISIGEHHEEQRELWTDECNADADQALYHKERSDFVKIAITAALPEHAKCPS